MIAGLFASFMTNALGAVPVTAPGSQRALILYDGAVTNGDGLLVARQVGNLLGHFDFQAEVRHFSTYTADLAGRFGAVFVCGMGADTLVPAPLLEDLSRREQPTVWIHLHLGQLTALPNVAEKLGFEYVTDDDSGKFLTVTYHGTKLPKTDAPIDRVQILDNSLVQVLATSESEEESESVPYVLRSGQFWYFAARAFSFTAVSDQSLVFADLLHDILGVSHAEAPRALVRIEDVSANSDPEELRRTADVLVSHGVTFQVAVIPVFKDPVNHVEMTLAEQPEVVAAVRYMAAHGGTVVMHGVTHQLRGVSGVDYEFWDAVANHPTADGAPAVLRPKLQHGLEECFRVGLYPLAFETPHYAASLEHYRSLATIFSHCYERRLACADDDDTQEYFPFPTTDLYGQRLIPENLGYVTSENPQVEPIISGARRLKVVRDPIASFFFHPFMPAKYLDQILTALQADGYRFISIKDFTPSMALGDYAVSALARSLTLTPLQPFLKLTTVTAQGERSDEYRPVERGKPVTLELRPPPQGLVAVQGAPRGPKARPRAGWSARIKSYLSGRDPDSLPVSTVRARQALLAGTSAAFESVLGSYGIPWQRFDPTNRIPDDAFVVVLQNAAMDEETLTRLAGWVEQGGRALLEGHTPLAERLGFDFTGPKFKTGAMQDTLAPDLEIRWTHPALLERFAPPPINTTLMSDSDSEQPVAAAARVGDGIVLYLAAELDPDTHLGYARFPFLVQHLRQRFHLELPVSAGGIEYYFDPGFREKTMLENLVETWHAEGVRAIYAAAWHFYPKWSYDYDRLIRLCHEQGIAVYAWIELPQVCDQFWNDHPEWREQTAAGQDAVVGWRKFMNLANPACRADALKFVDDLLDHHDWDGVNIAELCFDSPGGPAKPEGYIPMNQDVRTEFGRQAGFDPRQLCDENSAHHWRKDPAGLAQWTRFRAHLTRDWLAELLDHVTRRKLDVIVTALDSLSAPEVVGRNGCDSADVVGLMDRYNFTLQVEDPAEMWGEPPARYAQYAENYRKIVHDPGRLMFDINVVKDRPAGAAPTGLAAGIELALTARSAAAAGNGRVAVYSEFTVLEEDHALLPYVLGSGTQVTTASNLTIVRADRPVQFHYAAPAGNNQGWLRRGLGDETWPVPLVDGQPWSYGGKGVLLLGPGKHSFSGFQGGLGTHTVWVKDCTAPFWPGIPTSTDLTLDYDSARRGWLTLSRSPLKVLADGQSLEASAIHRRGEDWLISLAPGRHHLQIQKSTAAATAVEQAGARASTAIVWVATRSVCVLAVLCVASRFQRLALRWRSPRKEEHA